MPVSLIQRRFDKAMERDDPSELAPLILEVAQEADDPAWAEVCCARLCRHRNAHVHANALTGFGHLARRFGRLDRRRVQRLIEIGLGARHEVVREGASSAADDTETYMAWRFDRG